MSIQQHVEILAIGNNPKDVEIGVGGILLKMAHRGYTTVICDLTRSGPETDATPEELSLMASKASKILHVSDRINLNLEDKQPLSTIDKANALVECINSYRPDLILAPYWEDWHPDIHTTRQIIQNAIYLAGLKRRTDFSKPYKSGWIFYYPLNKPALPQIVVNITSTFEGKIEAIKAYHRKAEKPSATNPLPPGYYKDHLFHIESRSRHFGSFINCRFGEGLLIDKPLPIEDICEFIGP